MVFQNKLITISILISITIYLISSCSLINNPNQTVNLNQLQQEIDKQQSYYSGFWRSCMENFTTYSDDTLEKITNYCEKRLKQAVDNDYYNGEKDGKLFPFVSTTKDFTNNNEYEFYRGGWNECYIDVVTMSDLKGQQLLDFCSGILAESKSKDWSNKKNDKFPEQPKVILATPEPQS